MFGFGDRKFVFYTRDIATNDFQLIHSNAVGELTFYRWQTVIYQRTGDPKALDTLLAYNIQDTLNLENLIVTAYNMKLKDTPFYKTHLIEDPTPPVNPCSADLATVDRIKNSSNYWSSDQWY